MIKLSFLFLSGMTLNTLAIDQQQVEIKGTIVGMPDQTSLYLVRTSAAGGADTVQSAVSSNGGFGFSYKALPDGQVYFILLDEKSEAVKGLKINWIRVLLDTSAVRISGDFQSWPSVKIEGSEGTQVYENFFVKESALITQHAVPARINTSEDSVKFNQAMQNVKAFEKQYFQENKGSLATPALILGSGKFSTAERQQLYDMLSEEVKDSYHGKKLKEDIRRMTLGAGVSIGNVIPEFALEDKSGQAVSIREVAAKNKYTLVDFWAYWCVPCRENVPYMKKTYAAFHEKGFNIIGVSVDPNYQAWVKALKELNMDWMNVIDKQKAAMDIFSIGAIPAYILLNDKAEIVAMQIINLKPKNGSATKDINFTFHGDDLYNYISTLIK